MCVEIDVELDTDTQPSVLNFEFGEKNQIGSSAASPLIYGHYNRPRPIPCEIANIISAP